MADSQPFHEALAQRYPNEVTRKAVLSGFRYCLTQGDDPVVLYVDQFWTERERLILQIDRFDPKLQSNQVLPLHDISIKKPYNEETKRLNQILRKQKVVGYITPRNAKELRRMLRLPSFFPLYQLEDSCESLIPWHLARRRYSWRPKGCG